MPLTVLNLTGRCGGTNAAYNASSQESPSNSATADYKFRRGQWRSSEWDHEIGLKVMPRGMLRLGLGLRVVWIYVEFRDPCPLVMVRVSNRLRVRVRNGLRVRARRARGLGGQAVRGRMG